MTSPKARAKRPPPSAALAAAADEPDFAEVVSMIQAARGRALTAVNKELVGL